MVGGGGGLVGVMVGVSVGNGVAVAVGGNGVGVSVGMGVKVAVGVLVGVGVAGRVGVKVGCKVRTGSTVCCRAAATNRSKGEARVQAEVKAMLRSKEPVNRVQIISFIAIIAVSKPFCYYECSECSECSPNFRQTLTVLETFRVYCPKKMNHLFSRSWFGRWFTRLFSRFGCRFSRWLSGRLNRWLNNCRLNLSRGQRRGKVDCGDGATETGAIAAQIGGIILAEGGPQVLGGIIPGTTPHHLEVTAEIFLQLITVAGIAEI